MSNTITHLAVANKILSLKEKLVHNKYLFLLGSIAPDTIGSKKNATRFDKKRVHLREDIRDNEWLSKEKLELFDLRIKDFISNNIKNEKDDNQRDFNLGYLVHLLVDKYNHQTIRQKMIDFANKESIQESDKEFYFMMINELEALDNYLIEKYQYIKEMFEMISNQTVNYYLPGYIEKEYIESSINWWNSQYLLNIKERKLKYLLNQDIEEFIEETSNEIIKELNDLI